MRILTLRDRYDRRHAMPLQHPIDREIRDRLRRLGPKQGSFARAIGRSQGWLNKYMNGAGHATVDDVIRIAAVLIGAEMPKLTDAQRRLLHAWDQIPAESQEDAVNLFEVYARRLRRGLPPRSTAPKGQTPPATERTTRERRRADAATGNPRR